MNTLPTMAPRVNGILETSLDVESAARSARFYSRVFGFEPLEPGEPLNDETRLCPMRAGDRSVLLLFKKGLTADTNLTGAIHIAFGIARPDLAAWERWLNEQGISIESANARSQFRGGTMNRERTLKVVLVVVGLLFTAGIVPLTMFFSSMAVTLAPLIAAAYLTYWGIIGLRTWA